MSIMRKGIWSAIAVSATFGAMQFASGHDLTSGLRGFSAGPEQGEQGVNQGVNRASKADRQGGLEHGLSALSAPTRTISFKVDRLADTSVLVRIPLPQEADSAAPPTVLIKSEDQKAKLACEPMVSVLTDIAKRLPPGRCVT
jgi:hypothetical protein